MKPLKVLITNSCSKTAYAFLPMLCSGDVFGSQQVIDLVLFDFKPLTEKLAFLKEELAECCYANIQSITATVDMKHAFHNVDVAILFELEYDVIGFRNNSVLFRSYGIIINAHASKNIKVLVCGNTANTSAFICSSFSPSIPPNNYTCLVQNLKHNIIFNFLKRRNSYGRKKLTNKPHDDKIHYEQYGNNEKALIPTNNQQPSKVYCKLVEEFIKNNESLFSDSENIKSSANISPDNSDVFVWGSCNKPIFTSQSMNKSYKSGIILKPGAMVTAKSMSEHLRFWLTDFDDKKVVNMGVLSRNNIYNIDQNIYFSLPIVKKSHKNKLTSIIHSDGDSHKNAPGFYTIDEGGISNNQLASSTAQSYLMNAGETTVVSTCASQQPLEPLKTQISTQLNGLLLETSDQLCQERDKAIIDCWRIVLPHSHL